MVSLVRVPRPISARLLPCGFALALALGSPFRAGGQDAPAAPEWRVVDSVLHWPLADAEIWGVYDEVLDSYSHPTYPPPVLLGRSREDGSFSLQGFDTARGSVQVCHLGYVAHSLPPLGPGAPPVVALEPAAWLAGRVLTPEGRPVAGAKVLARNPRWEPGDVVILDAAPKSPCPWSEATGEATTDGEGRFSLSPLAPNRYDLWVTAPGYSRAHFSRRFELRPSEGANDLEIRLSPGAVVRGRVTTSQGDPVAGAHVHDYEDEAEAVTDARGAYRLTGVSPGPRTLFVDAKLDLEGRAKSLDLAVRPGENRLDFTLPPPGREVRGRVLTPDGSPLGGALLQLEDECTERQSAPRSRADGSFSIHVPEGAKRLLAFHDGYSPGAIDLPAATPAGLVVRLVPEQRLTGRIAGSAARGTQVMLYRSAALGCVLRASVQPDGTFRFAGVWPGSWTVIPEADPRQERRIEIPPGGDSRVDFSLPPRLAVRGRVVDEAGGPVAGAKVHIGPREWEALSAADGTFALTVEAGTWVAWAEREGFGVSPEETIEVAPPTPRAVELVVPQGALLLVRLHGLPAGQSASLQATGQQQPFSRLGIARGDGLFEIQGLPPGEWRIEARLRPLPAPVDPLRGESALVTRGVTLAPDDRERELDLTFPHGGLTLSGHVANPREWVFTVTLRSLDLPSAAFFAYPAPDEPFRFAGLPAGRYLLEVGGAFSPIRKEIELDADREIEVTIPGG